MPDRENERFDIDEEFLAEQEDSSDFDHMLDNFEKRVCTQG